MSQAMGLVLSSATAAAVSAYVCFHPDEIATMFWRVRSGALIDTTTLRLLRYFALARIVALLGLAWASPDPTIALVGAAFMTAHAVLCDFAWKHHWRVLTGTRVLGGLVIFQALILRLDPEPQSRIAQALVGLVMLLKPNVGASESFDFPSGRQLLGTRLLGAIGTVGFIGLTIHLIMEPALLPALTLADLRAGGTPAPSH